MGDTGRYGSLSVALRSQKHAKLLTFYEFPAMLRSAFIQDRAHGVFTRYVPGDFLRAWCPILGEKGSFTTISQNC